MLSATIRHNKLTQGYENGVTAEDVVTEVFRRIDVITTGIFLHLIEQERILSEARDLDNLTYFASLGAYRTS